MSDVGLDAEWQLIAGTDEFFNVTKAFHNGLQGMEIPLTDDMKQIWLRYNEDNARNFEGEYDYVIVHDPQPAGLLHYHGHEGSQHWIWRCHIDTSTPNPDYWNFIAPFISTYDAGVFTARQYVGPGLNLPHLAFIAPTIDPLSPKNRHTSPDTDYAILSRFGVDVNRPLLVQVSRFDPWKDPLGVIDAYRLVKREMPEVQLALVGSMAHDDPEGWVFYDRTVRHAGEDFDIVILTNFNGVGNREVNAFQSRAQVVIQKSIREGFGLTVSEALWKGVPVIGGNVGGIPMQIRDGETGFLVNSIQECADKALYLLRNPEERRAMGKRAREDVRQNFLTTRLLGDWLRLFSHLRTRGNS
jgi:trehalose synthase